jgi:transposase
MPNSLFASSALNIRCDTLIALSSGIFGVSTTSHTMTRSQITELEKGQILAWSGFLSLSQIATKLNRHVRTVMRVLEKYRKTGSTNRRKGSGRPRKTSPREDIVITRSATANRSISAPDICKQTKLNVSPQTVRNRLHESNLTSHWSVKKPWISESNRKKRLKWAREHLTWDFDQWKQVLWSDESPFHLRSKGRKRVWRAKGERISPEVTKATLKHDRKINVWGCFTATGVGELHLIDGIMDAVKYKRILSTKMIPSANRLFGQDEWVFQQDNDPKHTARTVQSYLSNKQVTVLEWPAQSPDLNPIENLWSILERKVQERSPKSEQQLFDLLQAEWQLMTEEKLSSLVESMPRRCQAVIDNKGYATKY